MQGRGKGIGLSTERPDAMKPAQSVWTPPIVASFLFLGMAGCGILSPESKWERMERELNRSRHRWETEGIRSYSSVQTFLCECIPFFEGPSRVWVVDGFVKRVEKVPSGEALREEIWSAWYTVDEMFQMIAEAIDERAVFLDVEYDPARGFPTRIAVDWRGELVDDERVIEVGDFLENGGG